MSQALSDDHLLCMVICWCEGKSSCRSFPI